MQETYSSFVCEPKDFTRSDGSHKTSGKRGVVAVQGLFEDLLLSIAGNDKGGSVGMAQDGVGECDPPGRRFRRVFEVGYPTQFFLQEFVAGEKGARVAVGSHSQEDEVEAWKCDGILASEGSYQLLLVVSVSAARTWF